MWKFFENKNAVVQHAFEYDFESLWNWKKCRTGSLTVRFIYVGGCDLLQYDLTRDIIEHEDEESVSKSIFNARPPLPGHGSYVTSGQGGIWEQTVCDNEQLLTTL